MRVLTADEKKYLSRLEKGRKRAYGKVIILLILLAALAHLAYGLNVKDAMPVLARDCFWAAGWWTTSAFFLALMIRMRNKMLGIIDKLKK